MRVIHDGYAITTYGSKSMSVSDRTGKEIFHTDDRPVFKNEKELKKYLEEFVHAVKNGG